MDNRIFLGKYRVPAEEIGAVGEVGDSPLAYEGEEIDSGKQVIVEVVPAASLKMVVRERLEAEALAAKTLSHVNIPALYDFGVEDDHLVYITEDFDGTLAEEWVNTHGPMPVGPVLRIASQVVSALGAAAFHRIVHHAINPTNLVLVPGQTAEGEWPLVKVLHFVGVAPKFPGTDGAVGAFDKSLHYASPEQIQHGAVDFRSEIYSLGGTLWFLLTGTPPPTAAQLTKTGLAVDRISATPGRVGRLLAQMLSANPAERPRDPLAFYRQLQDCLTDLERREKPVRTSAVPAPRTIAIDQPKRRRPLKALAFAALFLAIATLAVLVLPGYLRHRRAVHAEEPIGVPIGVTDAFASATPVTARAADTMVSIVTQPTPAVVDSNSTQSVAAKSTESDNANAPDSVEIASPKQVAVALVQPTTQDSPVSRQTQEQTTPKKIIMHEVRRAQPAEEEVKPAEPAPPGEGPGDVAPGTTASPGQQLNSVTQTEQSRDAKRETVKTRSRKVKRTDSEPTILLKVPR